MFSVMAFQVPLALFINILQLTSFVVPDHDLEQNSYESVETGLVKVIIVLLLQSKTTSSILSGKSTLSF